MMQKSPLSIKTWAQNIKHSNCTELLCSIVIIMYHIHSGNTVYTLSTFCASHFHSASSHLPLHPVTYSPKKKKWHRHSNRSFLSCSWIKPVWRLHILSAISTYFYSGAAVLFETHRCFKWVTSYTARRVSAFFRYLALLYFRRPRAVPLAYFLVGLQHHGRCLLLKLFLSLRFTESQGLLCTHTHTHRCIVWLRGFLNGQVQCKRWCRMAEIGTIRFLGEKMARQVKRTKKYKSLNINDARKK